MAKYDQLKKRKDNIEHMATISDNNLIILSNEHARVANIFEHTSDILDSIENEFEKETGLNGIDTTFLFIAVALQCVRQYFLTSFDERENDQKAANKVKKGEEEHSNRLNREYYASLEEIHNNPVPFDANKQIGEGKGSLKGGGKLGHRLTLGHDPILGWLFGTANIATSTLTTWTFKTYHVETQKGNTRGGVRDFDHITKKADSLEMLKRAKERFFEEGFEGYLTLIACLCKEWKHLKSDVNSTNSLPFPIVSTISPELANLFAEYGIGTANVLTVSKQITMTEAINCLVAILHGMLCYHLTAPTLPEKYEDIPYDEYKSFIAKSKQALILNKVKTKKIILYSNLIASTSNIIRVGIGVHSGDISTMRQLDVGGILNTIRHLFIDTKFIKEIKKEFIMKRWSEILLGEDIKFEEIK